MRARRRSVNDGSSRSRSGTASLACRRASSGSADRGVLLGELLVEPAVGSTLAFRPGDGLLEERDRLVGAAERSQGLPDRVARDLDGRGVRRIAFARSQRTFEGVERRLEIAGLVVLPPEVVEERPEPVRRVVVELGELDSSLRPVEDVVTVAWRRARPCAPRRRR